MDKPDELKIKQEFESKPLQQCRTCLAIGRKLLPIGNSINIYEKLFFNYNQDTKLHQLCWECKANLQKINKFIQRAQLADKLLQMNQAYIYGSLSSLATVSINEHYPNIIYVTTYDSIENNDKPSDANNTFDDNDNNESNYIKCDNNVYDVNTTNMRDVKYVNFDKLGFTEENELINRETIKVKTKNRWASKKAAQNKKKKFKVVTGHNLKFDDAFLKVHASLNELGSKVKEEIDDKTSDLRCVKCMLDFENEAKFARHIKKYHSKNLYVCDICQRDFFLKRHLSKHVQKHYTQYICKMCGYSSHREIESRRHLEKTHAKVFLCIKCGIKTGSRKEFYEHFKKWHERFICDYCGISFKMRYCIKDHLRKRHSQHECKTCNKQFARYNGLWLHNKICHSVSHSAYCVECDKTFPDQYRYKWHLNNSVRHTAHRVAKKIPCPECNKIFTKKIYMKDHYDLVHLKFYKYRCEECDKNFVRNADLVKHRRKVHEGILPPKNKVCFVCGRGFTVNNH